MTSSIVISCTGAYRSSERPSRTPLRLTLCFLALVMALAGPGACAAWSHGTHATLEHTALHDRAVRHGLLDHHGIHHSPQSGPEVCFLDGSEIRHALMAMGPAIESGTYGASISPDSLNGVRPMFAQDTRPDPGRRLLPLLLLGTEQHYPSPDHKPPISL
ncbi:MAG: hypothetical protein M3Q29_11165 [Chloroflexota bacterium]|nr:hypothetical protein [Chloroflexota bacterium]